MIGIVIPTALTAAMALAPIQDGSDKELSNHAGTIFGPTGLISVPTAYTAGLRSADVNMFFGKDNRTAGANFSLIKDIEVGGTWINRNGANDRGMANAKIRIIPSNFKQFEVGAGVIDGFDAINRTFYVVGSATLATPNLAADKVGQAIGFKVHAGVGTGFFRERLIGGAELQFGQGFSIIGEYDARNFNGAIRYSHKDYFGVQAGFWNKGVFVGATTKLNF